MGNLIKTKARPYVRVEGDFGNSTHRVGYFDLPCPTADVQAVLLAPCMYEAINNLSKALTMLETFEITHAELVDQVRECVAVLELSHETCHPPCP